MFNYKNTFSTLVSINQNIASTRILFEKISLAFFSWIMLYSVEQA